MVHIPGISRIRLHHELQCNKLIFRCRQAATLQDISKRNRYSYPFAIGVVDTHRYWVKLASSFATSLQGEVVSTILTAAGTIVTIVIEWIRRIGSHLKLQHIVLRVSRGIKPFPVATETSTVP